MLAAILTGIITATLVFLPRYLDSRLATFTGSIPIILLGVGLLAVLLQKYVIDRRKGDPTYSGLSDLYLQVHSPSGFHSSLHWLVRGCMSLILTCFGGIAGPEGAAVEFAQAVNMKIKMRYSRWFEQKRRTDAASSLAGGVAAAFGAPFAGLLFPFELGIGGRGMASALSALSAYFMIHFLMLEFSITGFDASGVLTEYRLTDSESWRQWFGVVAVGLVSGLCSVLLIKFVRYAQDSLRGLFKTQVWKRNCVGGIFLALLFSMGVQGNRPFHDFSWNLLEQVLWMKRAPLEVLLLLLSQSMVFVVLLSSFGTVGVLWPLLAMGGCLGFCVHHWIIQGISQGVLQGMFPGFLSERMMDFSPISALAGAAALCGAALGVPFTASVIVYELTQNIQVALPCLVAALIAQKCREMLRSKSLITEELQCRGLTLVEGRALDVLNAIAVQDAMVTNFETIHDHEVISDIKARVLKSTYPFLPVVNSQGIFKGLLTLDMIREAELLGTQFLEAKDILYRAGYKSPHVKGTDRLTLVVKKFEEVPCLPVVEDDGRVSGLLFVYSVRLAYEREVARRSFSFVRDADTLIG